MTQPRPAQPYFPPPLHHTKIEFVQQELNVSRLTAGSYLNQLAEPGGMLQKHKLGKSNYYVNQPLYELLARLG